VIERAFQGERPAPLAIRFGLYNMYFIPKARIPVQIPASGTFSTLYLKKQKTSGKKDC
jgi:hypothetical protein